MANVVNVEMSAKAYIKPILHAAKYPHCSVNGILLAEKQKEDKSSLKFVDAVPLFHSSLTLAPMMEIALTMIDSYCEPRNIVIAGYYQANENLQDSSPIGIACSVSDKIRDHFSDACLVMLNNEKAFKETDSAFILYTPAENRWKKSDKRIQVDDSSLKLAKSMVESRLFRSLVDFDNHLDDISLDWRNQDLNEQIDD